MKRLSAWRKSLAGEIVEIAIIAVVLFLIVRVAVQNFRVIGSSMRPTLQNNELVLVDKVSYEFTSPSRGDIVVFRSPPPIHPPHDLIKRVIGVPGDRIRIHGGAVYRNGKRLREPYAASPDYKMSTIPRTKSDVVPPNDYFVLGDNRNNSDDSHLWGLVPRKDIIGRALVSYWPLSRFGFLW